MEPTLDHKLALRLITSIQARIERKSPPHFPILFYFDWWERLHQMDKMFRNPKWEYWNSQIMNLIIFHTHNSFISFYWTFSNWKVVSFDRIFSTSCHMFPLKVIWPLFLGFLWLWVKLWIWFLTFFEVITFN
jgi:hypothetical protein